MILVELCAQGMMVFWMFHFFFLRASLNGGQIPRFHCCKFTAKTMQYNTSMLSLVMDEIYWHNIPCLFLASSMIC